MKCVTRSFSVSNIPTHTASGLQLLYNNCVCVSPMSRVAEGWRQPEDQQHGAGVWGGQVQSCPYIGQWAQKWVSANLSLNHLVQYFLNSLSLQVIVNCFSSAAGAPSPRHETHCHTVDLYVLLTCNVNVTSWSWHKAASTTSEIISNRVCGIWFDIDKGASVLIIVK